jgi:hypothetical protein
MPARYDAAVDRLDAWLNAQRGWRRFALMWLWLYPLGWLVGDIWLGGENLISDRSPSTGYLYWFAVLSIPVALTLAALALPMRAAHARSRARRGKSQEPMVTWRWMGCLILMTSNSTVAACMENQAVIWKRQHPLAASISLVLAVCLLALLLENFRYTRRVRARLTKIPVADMPPFPDVGQPLG